MISVEFLGPNSPAVTVNMASEGWFANMCVLGTVSIFDRSFGVSKVRSSGTFRPKPKIVGARSSFSFSPPFPFHSPPSRPSPFSLLPLLHLS